VNVSFSIELVLKAKPYFINLIYMKCGSSWDSVDRTFYTRNI